MGLRESFVVGLAALDPLYRCFRNRNYFVDPADQPSRRQVPAYYSDKHFRVESIRIRLVNVSRLDRLLLVPVLERLVNRSFVVQDFFERRLCHSMPSLNGTRFLILSSCRDRCCGDSLPRGSGDLLIVHEKAVPAMMGVYNTQPHHGGTANGRRKEARSSATASQVVDRIDA